MRLFEIRCQTLAEIQRKFLFYQIIKKVTIKYYTIKLIFLHSLVTKQDRELIRPFKKQATAFSTSPTIQEVSKELKHTQTAGVPAVEKRKKN